MQSVISQKTAFTGSALRAAERSQKCNRASLVVRAENESRRAIISGMVAGIAGLGLVNKASAEIEIIDDRQAKKRGFDIIYEARDVDLPQAQRDGFTQARGSIEETKKRIAESERRIDEKLPTFVNKKYWTNAREELRLQIGTLRFDLDTLASQLPKADKKKAQALAKTFFKQADQLDYAIRCKDPEEAQKALSITRSSLDAALSGLV
jgi:photosystem II oxygen-evolving enhancer protein 3